MDEPVPRALVLGCNTPDAIGVLSDWIEERTGYAADFAATGWSDDYCYISSGDGYGHFNMTHWHDGGIIRCGFGNGQGNGFGYGEVRSSVTRRGYITGDGNGCGCGDGYGWNDGDGQGNGRSGCCDYGDFYGGGTGSRDGIDLGCSSKLLPCEALRWTSHLFPPR